MNTGTAMAGVRRWSAGHGWGRGDSAAGAGAEMVRVAVLDALGCAGALWGFLGAGG
jgi:hypothetical protein